MTTPAPSSSRSCIIFGAAGAIGAATARLLVADGVQVMLAGRTQAKLDALAQALGGCPTVMVDATDSAAVDAAVTAAKDKFGRLDGLMNCVGSFALKPLHLVSDADFEADLAQNLRSAFFTTRAGVRAMQGSETGSIVLLSSVAARFGMPNHESLASAKAGILGLMLSAAATYAADNIRINAIAPGLIKSPLTRSIVDNPPMAQASAGMHPLRRLGEPEDVARMARFLLDPENSFVTGQIMGVDGGLATLRPKR